MSKSSEKRIFKVRVQNVSYQDLVVRAANQEEAKALALKHYEDTGNGEFVEFLPVTKEDLERRTIYGN